MDSFKIRQKFLDYFKKNGHAVVPSSSLIPAEDPTLLFTNAGMNQFKDLFLGNEKRSYTRATSSQKCVRAGGKHNDLDEVGFTNRHLTFFEMLGNFSFGDYFKKEAINFAWEFLTEEIGIDPKRLSVSVYKTDDEAYDLWNKMIKVPADRIFKLGEKENFWQMGDTGPCGPCTEIHIDYGADKGCKTKFCDPSCSCGRYVEIWNLVFMQYNRQSDGTLNPLKQTGVDTGMGLERLTMVLQDKSSVFATDLFDYLTSVIEKETGVSYNDSKKELKAAFHVLGDHVRSSSLLIADGCSPSNEGRGYVLRKIIRRAALFARKLTNNQALFPTLAKAFINKMDPVFTNLKSNEKLIVSVITSEVQRFASSLDQGQLIFEKYVEQAGSEKKIISGEQVFKLYDTYGFPPELTRVMAYDCGFTVDMAGFEGEMEKQRLQSGKKESDFIPSIPTEISTEFVGYEKLEVKTKINFVQSNDDFSWIVTEKSPFYVECGGQVGDNGFININSKDYPVKSLYKSGNAIALKIENPSKIDTGTEVLLTVDYISRRSSERNHSATHLLQAALVKVLGKGIKQAGSLVSQDYLRFDFSHTDAMTPEQLIEVEKIANSMIQKNITVETFNTTLKEAQKAGVTAFFGEKYNPENVRVVKMGDVSAELCGGTHVRMTGEIGSLKITSETALSTGTRRITAVTGSEATSLFQLTFSTTKSLGELFKVKPELVLSAVKKQSEELAQTHRDIKLLRKKFLKLEAVEWQSKVKVFGKIPFLFLDVEGYESDELRPICQEIEKGAPGFYFVISRSSDGRVNFAGYVGKNFVSQVNLSELSGLLKDSCGLRSGGKGDFIQGGGVNVDVLLVKSVVEKWISKK